MASLKSECTLKRVNNCSESKITAVTVFGKCGRWIYNISNADG
jgi:hypothetical protein